MKNIKNMIVVGGLCLSIACSAVFTLSPMTVYAINTIEYETEYMEPIEESDYLVNQNSREYSDTGRPLVTVEKSTQYAGQVHLTKKLNTVGSPQLI
ncbi:hypothetical protein [Catenibacterium sp.]|uniref:hypothetical protein n=1 Tax=Catenibacterium sp. TaxID=2049022 RepID=UPI003AB6CC95